MIETVQKFKIEKGFGNDLCFFYANNDVVCFDIGGVEHDPECYLSFNKRELGEFINILNSLYDEINSTLEICEQ